MELVVGVGGGEDAGGAVRVHRGGRDRWRDKNDGLGGSETDAVAECRLFFFWGTMQNADLRCVWKSEARGGQPVLTRVVAGFVAHARAYILLE